MKEKLLLQLITEGFRKFEEKLDKKIDDLAAITQRSFEQMDHRMLEMEKNLTHRIAILERGFLRLEDSENGLGDRMNVLEDRMTKLESNQYKVLDKLTTLETGQSRIENELVDVKLRLDNTAHKFEIKQHDVRLTKIEKRVGLK